MTSSPDAQMATMIENLKANTGRSLDEWIALSRKGGPAMSKPFRHPLFSKIAVVGAEPVAPAEATPANLQEIVGRLRGDWK